MPAMRATLPDDLAIIAPHETRPLSRLFSDFPNERRGIGGKISSVVAESITTFVHRF
jgi:hypothetical protein